MQAPGVIYSIGYGNRPLIDFIALLKQFTIGYLIDIRSQPYSKFHPDYSRTTLERAIRQQEIAYVYMGGELGGRPDDPTCYMADGKVNYAQCVQRAAYQQGIARLETALQGGHRVALMCTEAKPEHCHRSKLVGETLRKQNRAVIHIDETGATKTQEQVIALLRAELDNVPTAQSALPGFGDEVRLTSRKAVIDKVTFTEAGIDTGEEIDIEND